MDLPWGFYLGWGWNPVVFFIILGLSLLLAMLMGKWQVLWVLPALVLYSGLDWIIPYLWVIPLMALFKLVFWVSVLVAIVTAVLPGKTRLARVPIYMMVALIIWDLILALFGGILSWTAVIILAIMGLVMLFIAKMRVLGAALLAAAVIIAGILLVDWNAGQGPDFSEDDAYDRCINLPGVQPEVPDGYRHTEADRCIKGEELPEVDCPARFVQDLDPNRRFRFDSGGFEGTPEQKRRQQIAALASDYRYLAFFGETLFKRNIDEDLLVTADGECLNEKGRTLHAQVSGALMASGVRDGMAPQDGYNTGIKDDVPVVDKRRGVFGDRKATIYTLADGTKLIVLDRCGNIVLKSKPRDRPEGPTDNPPPPNQPENPPPDVGGCVEIPNNGIVDCGGAKRSEEEPAQEGNVPDNVTGNNPGTGGSPASQPSAQPKDTYNPPDSPDSGSTHDAPPPEPSTPPSSNPEPSPTQDPCVTNPDWC